MSQDQVAVTVYTKPACVQCTAVIRFLAAKNIEHDLDDAIENTEAIQNLLQFKQAPVIRIVDKKKHTVKFFAGNNPDQLNELHELIQAA